MPSRSPFYYICYSVSDEAFARALALNLRHQNIPVFFDAVELEPGEDLEDVFAMASGYLVIVSRFALIDKNLFAKIADARKRNAKLYVLMAEACEPPSPINRIQAIDFTTNFNIAQQSLVKVLHTKDNHVFAQPASVGAAPRASKTVFKKILDSLSFFKKSKPASDEDETERRSGQTRNNIDDFGP